MLITAARFLICVKLFECLEHEACAIDINELRWHCAYTGRIETRLNERLRQAGKYMQIFFYTITLIYFFITLYVCFILIMMMSCFVFAMSLAYK